MRCIRFLRYHVGLVIHVEDVEGCAHGFFAEDVALYRFRKTRAGSVPAGVFGGRRPHGVLVTDRYTGYDRPWRVDRQYCHAHILRKFLRLLKKEPDNRGLVIARKTSFGGQSEGALRVREVNQSVMETLALRCEDPAAKLAQALDIYASTGKKSAVRDFLFPRAGWLDCAQRQAQR